MQATKVPLLSFAILGLIRENPSSGYDLRKLMSRTPLNTFSDSPGAIYPALRRLEASGLIRGKADPESRLRRRLVFRLTPAGVAELRKWLVRPITPEDVQHRLKELSLRFGFMDGTLGEEASLRFLNDLKQQLVAYVPGLRRFYESHKADMGLSARLILENGVEGYEAQLRWVDAAIATYERQRTRTRHAPS